MTTGYFSVDTEKREAKGILLPFDTLSRGPGSGTDGRKVKFAADDVRIPRDPMVVGLNDEHQRFRVIGRANVLEKRPEGVYAEFKFADTDAADAWLASHQEGAYFSAEVDEFRVLGEDKATGLIAGAAVTTQPAFEGTLATFSILNEEPEEEDEPGIERGIDEETPDPSPDEAEKEPEEEGETEGDAVAEATAKEVMLASAKPGAPKIDQRAYFRMIDEVMGGRASFETRQLVAQSMPGPAAMFTLDDIDYDGTNGVGAKMIPTQWIGEVPIVTYRPIYADLFPTRALTSLSLGGWKWTTKPVGGTWTGNKDAIPSEAAVVAAVTETATRWAGGNDIAREHRDFGTPGFFEAYNAAMRESYEKWKDQTIVRTELLAGATDVEADDPTGLTIGAGWSALIDGAASVVAAGYTPTFAVVELSLWKAMMKVPDSDTLGYLEASLNLTAGSLDGFAFRPDAGLTTGHILVGSREAADVYELPGSPVRAEALNIANGGIDVGLFGYAGLLIKDATGIVDVAPYVAGP